MKITNINRRVCICLSNNIFHNNFIDLYQNFIKQFVNFIIYIISNQKYQVILVPFDTDYNKSNDTNIQNDIMNLLPINIKNRVCNIQEKLKTKDILRLFNRS